MMTQSPFMANGASLVIAYLIGGLVPGYWIGKYLFKKDIRLEGSGNIGATNTYRVLGPSAGIIVFLLDMLKGVLAVWIGRQLSTDGLAAGVGAMLGHTFTPFLGFKGGKGVATGLGIYLCLATQAALIAFGIWCLTLAVWKVVGLSSVIAAVALGALVPVWAWPHSPALVVITETLVALTIWRHRENIRQLAGKNPPS